LKVPTFAVFTELYRHASSEVSETTHRM
jgi:hypothetical protein